MSDNSNARFAAETGTGAQLRRLAGKSGPLIALVALCLILSVLSPYFATADNLTNVSRQVAFVALLAIGMTLVIATGGIDLSVGAVMAIAGATAATTTAGRPRATPAGTTPACCPISSAWRPRTGRSAIIAAPRGRCM